MRPITDPSNGDFECDASSTKKRSLLSLAGSLLAEISLPKLVVSWVVLLGLPAVLLGATPIAGSIWVETVWRKLDAASQGIIPAVAFTIVVGIGVVAGRRMLRLAERSFWSLNSLAVQPVYAITREIVGQLGELILAKDASQQRRATWRAYTAGIAGVTICLCSLGVLLSAIPHTLVTAELGTFGSPVPLIKGAIANSVAIVASYVAVGSIAWAFADATMPLTSDYRSFASLEGAPHRWRIAHFSDIHTVGERFGFRIECGRNGPRGNERLTLAFALLERIHRADPLEAILLTGDITDAGLASEWAEFMAALAAFPDLAKLVLIIPGNHDINVVSRANPAQFDLPTSPYKKLRKIRVLSALQAVQGTRVRVVDRRSNRLDGTLDDALEPHVDRLSAFADSGKPRRLRGFDEVWASAFPMIVPPVRDDGLGFILMNSNADAHFSFTNALGFLSADQLAAAEGVFAQFPKAAWVVCLHHHLIEFPRRAEAVSERIGTALINGQWLVRRLQRNGARTLVLHGHRHVDWFGKCGSVRIFSAPSTVMGDEHGEGPRFYIHTLAASADGGLILAPPQVVEVNPVAAAPAGPDRAGKIVSRSR